MCAAPLLHSGLMRPLLRRLTTLGLSALLLAACEPPEPRASSLEPRALLQLRFDKPDEPQDLDVITSEEDRNAADRTVVRATVKPLQVAQLDETHAVLLTDVQTGQDCHACPGLMGAYFYERDARGWPPARTPWSKRGCMDGWARSPCTPWRPDNTPPRSKGAVAGRVTAAAGWS